MSITYSYLIPENVSPSNASKIGVYNEDGTRVCSATIPSSKKIDSSTLGTKQYSFGCISDLHVPYTTSGDDIQSALTYMNNSEDVDFVCICGDLTANGTVNDYTNYNNYISSYASDTPIYPCTGNHECYNEDVVNMFKTYTGKDMYYSFEKNNDVFIMFGVYKSTAGQLFTTASLKWLYETLEANRNKRVFLFQHVRPDDACGNAFGIYEYDIWDGEESTLFEAFLRHYKNVTFFHGHSHLKFYLQYGSSTANYDKVFGVNSIHIPSLTAPRNGDASGASSRQEVYADSEGYIVDVYDEHIILKGRDFVNNVFIPIAQYQIPTSITNVSAGTFVNPTSIVLEDKNITSITLDASKEINKDSNAILTATLNPSDANNYNLSWSCDNTSVATITQNGLKCTVNAIASGTANVTITDSISNKTATCVITVTDSGQDTGDGTTITFDDWTIQESGSVTYTINTDEVQISYPNYTNSFLMSKEYTGFTPGANVTVTFEKSTTTGAVKGFGILASSNLSGWDLSSDYETTSFTFTVPSSGSFYLAIRISSAYANAGGTYPVIATIKNAKYSVSTS